MSNYKIAITFAIIGLLLQLSVFLTPSEYFILSKYDGILRQGDLFPIALLSWCVSCLAGAFNFIYIEKLHIDGYVPVPRTRKILPSLICIPSALSFFWFCFKIFI